MQRTALSEQFDLERAARGRIDSDPGRAFTIFAQNGKIIDSLEKAIKQHSFFETKEASSSS